MKFIQSQAGQAEFVRKVLVEPENLMNGTFLDIGANHPIDWSNSYELEQIGWTGCLVENEPNAANMLRRGRTSRVIHADATRINWREFNQKHFDYLSLDIDYCSHSVLLEMLVAGMTFRVATIEDNEYNYPGGDSPRWANRALMQAKGYVRVAAGVLSVGQPFEDWYVHKSVPPSRWERFVSDGIDGNEIAKR
jgi:hypothetical protein